MPCGSGKKFKNCHGRTNPRQTYSTFFRIARPNAGVSPHIRAPVSTDFNGEKFVAVGNRLYHSSKWLTFHDFLFDYIKTCFGAEWGKRELSKPYTEMHPLIQWYQDLCAFQKRESQKSKRVVYDAVATGSAAAYLSVAYELYLLEHHDRLQAVLLNRLRDAKQFQGARYELYAASVFIKAGFEIAFEDETDRSESHCEFEATDPQTSKQFSLEAKSRHRPGFLGTPGQKQNPEEIRLRIGRLVNDALSKEAKHYRLVFVDVNMPPEEQQLFELSWFKPMNKTFREVEKQTDKAAILFFTNKPNHYVGNASDDPSKNYFLTAVNEPSFKQPDLKIAASRFPEVMRLWKAVNEYNNVPHTF